jgi:membrane associated rhomboid family serine protease
MASSQNIPGVVTSVFINKDFGDFSGNLFVAFVVLSFYSLSSTISGKRNDNLFIVAMWVSAILANLAFVLMSPAYLTIHAGSSGLTYVWVLPTTYGSSGLVSAFLSGVIILAYKSAWAEPVLRFKQFVIGIGLFALFIVLNLNVSPSTNIAVHLMSFLIMVFFVLSKRFWTWLFS